MLRCQAYRHNDNQGLGFRVPGRVEGSGFRVLGLGFRIWRCGLYTDHLP